MVSTSPASSGVMGRMSDESAIGFSSGRFDTFSARYRDAHRVSPGTTR